MSKLSGAQRLSQAYHRGTMFEVIRAIEDQVNKITEGRQGAYHGAMTAAPTTGEWVRGDWVKNSEPSAEGYFGFVCVTTGSPGTWKGFGEIEA